MVYPRQIQNRGEVLSTLLERADVQGYLTTDDILDLVATEGDDADAFGRLLTILRRMGIEVIAEDDDSSSTQSDGDTGEVEVGTYLSTLEHISADDTVGLYLKEMSRVPLLNIEEEVSLAQRIQHA